MTGKVSSRRSNESSSRTLNHHSVSLAFSVLLGVQFSTFPPVSQRTGPTKRNTKNCLTGMNSVVFAIFMGLFPRTSRGTQAAASSSPSGAGSSSFTFRLSICFGSAEGKKVKGNRRTQSVANNTSEKNALEVSPPNPSLATLPFLGVRILSQRGPRAWAKVGRSLLSSPLEAATQAA